MIVKEGKTPMKKIDRLVSELGSIAIKKLEKLLISVLLRKCTVTCLANFKDATNER